jgi:hypothetical protein
MRIRVWPHMYSETSELAQTDVKRQLNAAADSSVGRADRVEKLWRRIYAISFGNQVHVNIAHDVALEHLVPQVIAAVRAAFDPTHSLSEFGYEVRESLNKPSAHRKVRTRTDSFWIDLKMGEYRLQEVYLSHLPEHRRLRTNQSLRDQGIEEDDLVALLAHYEYIELQSFAVVGEWGGVMLPA